MIYPREMSRLDWVFRKHPFFDDIVAIERQTAFKVFIFAAHAGAMHRYVAVIGSRAIRSWIQRLLLY
jgi:hypothetical protein